MGCLIISNGYLYDTVNWLYDTDNSVVTSGYMKFKLKKGTENNVIGFGRDENIGFNLITEELTLTRLETCFITLHLRNLKSVSYI